jgi:oleate hydratase
VEFRRYLHRFIHELPRINTLAGIDRTPYNQYDSIILPLTEYLIKAGVEIKYGTSTPATCLFYYLLLTHLLDVRVTSFTYADPSQSERITVQDIHMVEAGSTGVIHVHDRDIVFVTLGSMTSSSTFGTNETPPAVRPSYSNDGSWELWKSLSHDSPRFGNPFNFSDRVPESHWESFTITLKSPEFLNQIVAFTRNEPGTGALTTFADSNWLMSIVIPHQPHFISQPPDVQVLWGYGLFPMRKGNFVHKPMSECSGEEIFTELLGHVGLPQKPYQSTTIPCSMPYITSQFLTRGPGDRPEVIPKGSTNLAFIGQFVEIPLDVVFTVEYSVRSAMIAVCGLMGLKEQPRSVYEGEHDPRVLAKVLKAMVEDGVGNNSGSSRFEMNVTPINLAVF